MSLPSRFKEKIIVSGALALVCLGPLFASAKIPAGLPDCRTVQDPIQATASARASQPGEQQDPSSQSQPLTAERVISKPPRISYEDGQLTIIAENSPLSEVMSALRAAVGADIDLPPSVARQRIWVRLGPGPARKVLRDLLDNTELDYVIQASDTDTQGIRSVLLTLHSKTPEQVVQGSQVAQGTSRKNLPDNSDPAEVPEQDTSAPAESAAVSDTAPAGPASPPPGAQSAAAKLQSAPGASQLILSAPSAGTSTEQMVQQLQSMYEQRKQLQLQQSQKPPLNNNN
jgi:hypothetical protein